MTRNNSVFLEAPTKLKSRAQHGSNSRIYHRVSDIAMHVSWYGFRTQARLARDSRASEAAISRLLNGHSTASLSLALRLASALEKRLQKSLSIEEVFSLDGNYPTSSVCELCDCRGCLPPRAYDANDYLRPEFSANLPA